MSRALVMVVDQNGWSRDSMSFDRRPVKACGNCGNTDEVWGQIEQFDALGSLSGSVVVCKKCLASHYMKNWPCLTLDGTVVNGGVPQEAIMRATKRDWRTDR